MKKKILIVDDDRVFCSITKKKLEKISQEFVIITASDGKDGVEKLQRNTISLVVTDLEMPQMDGFELLAYISEKYPDIPVIILTAHGSPESEKVILDSGGSGLINKPVKIEKLARAISAFLRRESEGGVFKAAPLRTVVNLVNKEKKTCTLRAVRRSSGQKGTLFFKDGELLGARIQNKEGKAAAKYILAWNKVILSIQNSCAYCEKKIQGNLSALLAEIDAAPPSSSPQAEPEN